MKISLIIAASLILASQAQAETWDMFLGKPNAAYYLSCVDAQGGAYSVNINSSTAKKKTMLVVSAQGRKSYLVEETKECLVADCGLPYDFRGYATKYRAVELFIGLGKNDVQGHIEGVKVTCVRQ